MRCNIILDLKRSIHLQKFRSDPGRLWMDLFIHTSCGGRRGSVPNVVWGFCRQLQHGRRPEMFCGHLEVTKSENSKPLHELVLEYGRLFDKLRHEARLHHSGQEAGIGKQNILRLPHTTRRHGVRPLSGHGWTFLHSSALPELFFSLYKVQSTYF